MMAKLPSRRRQLQACVLFALFTTLGCTEAQKGNHDMSNSRFGSGEAALEAAILADDATGVARTIAAGARVNAQDVQQVTPLMLAVDRLKLNAVTALLAAGAAPNAKAVDGTSAMTLAAQNYQRAPELIFALIRAGGDPNSRRRDGDPIIISVINDRNCAYIRRMIAAGADVNALTRNKEPLLIDAATGSDWDVVWCLLELGAEYRQPSGPPDFNLSQILAGPMPSPDSPIYPFKVKVRDFLRAKGLPAPDLAGDLPR